MSEAPGRLTVTLAEALPVLRTWMLSAIMPAVTLSNHITWLTTFAWGGAAAGTSLKLWWSCPRSPASRGGAGVTVPGPPIVPAGKLTYVAEPGPNANESGVAPGRPTVTCAITEPGFRTWMLSPAMPAVARSNHGM